MELLRYLNEHFLTREQVLANCGMEADTLAALQHRRMAPLPSYRLRLAVSCESFFGMHDEQAMLDYYPRGYPDWLRAVEAMDDAAHANDLFVHRYRTQLARLAADGLAVPEALATGEHVAAEWRHFLDGTYGVCTVTGLPEEIATKEAAALAVDAMTEGGGKRVLTTDEIRLLGRIVDMLDRAMAPFAPHEVDRSTRARLVNTVRRSFLEQGRHEAEERSRLTRKAMDDIDAGCVIDHQAMQAWADSLGKEDPLPPPVDA